MASSGTLVAGENCKCRFNGGYVDEGRTVCMRSPTGMTLARCEKVLNNTSWKMLDQPCPYASFSPGYIQDNRQLSLPASLALARS